MNGKNCVFCNIVTENSPEKILWQNEKLIVITDHRPAAQHHYLVITKHNVNDVRSLDCQQNEQDRLLVVGMLETAKEYLSSKAGLANK